MRILSLSDYSGDAVLKCPLHIRSSPGTLSQQEVVRRLSACGTQYIELTNSYCADVDPSILRADVEACKQSVVCLRFFYDFGSARDPVPIQHYLERAATLGAHIAVVYAAFSGDHTASHRNQLVQQLRKSADCARSLQLRLALKTMEWGAFSRSFGSARDYAVLAEAVGSEHFGIAYDTAVSIVSGEGPLKALDYLRDHLSHVILQNFSVVPEWEGIERYLISSDQMTTYAGAPLFEGDLPVLDVLRWLTRYRYEGTICIEYSGGDDFLSVLSDGIALARRYFNA
jgi:sugar phosphate isomerase/epimerase